MLATIGIDEHTIAVAVDNNFVKITVSRTAEDAGLVLGPHFERMILDGDEPYASMRRRRNGAVFPIPFRTLGGSASYLS